MYAKQEIKKGYFGICNCIMPDWVCNARNDTVRFNVTVPGDPKSKRIPKSDDEQKFYVTGTYFSSYGTLSCRSYQLENQHVFSETKDISRTAPSNKGKYKSWAKPHVYYFMSSHSSLNGMNVEGRYTP